MKKLLIVVLSLLALVLGFGLNQYLASDFEVLSGKAHKWRSSEGKWTVVNYFAEWCAPCLRELPELNDFHHQYGNSIRLFAVSYDPLTADELSSVQRKYEIKFPIIQTLKNIPWQQVPSSLPTTFILDPKGTVVTQLKGEQSAAKLKQTIDKLQRL
ncbi:MAG: TlpA disulfide reductase family protein [Paraglaciecola sp.]|uniref:TlpA family protein disulfide reductase n=1 Tax=Paraglaciecola sp. TaxID=1920173 RepID=UPI0032972A30